MRSCRWNSGAHASRVDPADYDPWEDYDPSDHVSEAQRDDEPDPDDAYDAAGNYVAELYEDGRAPRRDEDDDEPEADFAEAEDES